MVIDEQEMRSLLAETAALAGPPGFSADDVARRIRRNRRQRRRRAGVLGAVTVAAAASVIAVPLTLGTPASRHAISEPPPPAPRLSYTVTVNGQARAVPAAGPPALFRVAPGERLTMSVEVAVPGPGKMTALWLGITNGVLSGHAAMEPVLAASTRAALRPGGHRFVLHWTVPAGLAPGTSRQLSSEWAWRGPRPGHGQGIVADFAVPPRSGGTSPAAVAHRLRRMALDSVAICGGARPAWIRAARTTFSKAMAATGGGADLADTPAAPVYVLVMKGDFTLSNGGPVVPSCADAPTGRYFTAVIDAATLAVLGAGVGNHPPTVPLPHLGPLLNLSRR